MEKTISEKDFRQILANGLRFFRKSWLGDFKKYPNLMEMFSNMESYKISGWYCGVLDFTVISDIDQKVIVHARLALKRYFKYLSQKADNAEGRA